jgi:hypothetical protein
MPVFHDGPASPLFSPLPLKGNTTFGKLATAAVSKRMKDHVDSAPRGKCTCWGMPFDVGRPLLLADKSVTRQFEPLKARWLVFMHTTDFVATKRNRDGFISPTHGHGRLGEHVADYVICYAGGTEVRQPIRRRHQISMFQRPWGEGCFEAVGHRKPHAVRQLHEQPASGGRPENPVGWGWSQTRVQMEDSLLWTNWLWAWENPHPNKPIAGLRFEPKGQAIVVSGVSSGDARSMPLRWESRKKAVLRMPKGATLKPELDAAGQLAQIALDMGTVISAQPRPVYPKKGWADTYNNQMPKVSERDVIVEYTAHPDARFHLDGKSVLAGKLLQGVKAGPLTPIAPATQRVTIRVTEKGSKKPVAVKLHVHGKAGEYLPPVDRHRIPNWAWFEDYCPEFQNQEAHWCVYIPGEADVDLPVGRVFIEVSKGFDIKPIRKVVDVSQRTKQISLTVSKVLPWRERGWVTADTHVHFLSPPTANLEGAAEGVNVVNLLASQWGELMTNAGDFDGKTTFGSREAGGDGEYLVRVGTENRQHVLGHISLIGYNGRVIAPMTTGGPDESALGDPVDILLTEWARQCHAQGGLVVIPHFPNPRAEHAAAIIEGEADAIEMTAWGNLYGGIDPYSLSDWYRYLNCGYFVPAVGGTDKMSASTAVGTVRTYARVPRSRPFTYDAWMDAVRSGHTFVSYGPLLEFSVDGKRPGQSIRLTRSGGTVDIEWEVASVTVPMSRVELIVNGEIRESKQVKPGKDKGHWRLKVDRSSWAALLVRGHYPDKPEMIAAHSSPVMMHVSGTQFFAAADAMTILEQVEGALAYFDTIGTRADTAAYKRMRMVLTSAHRKLHNLLHQRGHDHAHTPATDHPEHHR